MLTEGSDTIQADHSCAETGTFRDNNDKTTAIDAVAHSVARSLAAMMCDVQGKQVYVFHEEGFQRCVPAEKSETLENVQIVLCFLKLIPRDNGYNTK